MMRIKDHEDLFADSIHVWRPGFELEEGEIQDLRAVEITVRHLWNRYGPQRPQPARLNSRDVAADNAAVDEFEEQNRAFLEVVLKLAVTADWRAFFPSPEHVRIEQAREIIIARGGTNRLSELE